MQHKIVDCDLCFTPMRSDNLKNHRNGKHCKLRCKTCGTLIQSARFKAHLATHEVDLKVGQDIPSPEEYSPQQSEVEEPLKDMYTLYNKYIAPYTRLGNMMDVYNYQLPIFSVEEIAYYFKDVFRYLINY